jgi:hypothetical protein
MKADSAVPVRPVCGALLHQVNQFRHPSRPTKQAATYMSNLGLMRPTNHAHRLHMLMQPATK